jgi:hypothetical protein
MKRKRSVVAALMGISGTMTYLLPRNIPAFETVTSRPGDYLRAMA